MSPASPAETKRRLDYYYSVVSSLILSRQSAVTGLIPASVAVTTHGDYRDAWVRDNVYSIYCVFGLALAYRRLDDDTGRAYELEHSTVKCMRGLLFSMMKQAHKVEKFKHTQNPLDALHAKYNTQSGDPVVADWEWGHLQVDATSIFVLALAEMTTAGLVIVYNQDEVDFVQNLVFYIERAYRTPDYGIWERGNKINHGQPELNSSSVGMALAALQAINGVNLYGARGGAGSVVHAYPDEITRNFMTLVSALPRESNSKEVDAALLSVVGWPAFAINDQELVNLTKNEIREKLQGKYGCKRFLRDGHQTVLEDNSRLHYEPHELRRFENIESEWPLFFTYSLIDALFVNDTKSVQEYSELLKPLLVLSSSHRDEGVETKPEDGFHMGLVPELFIVPHNSIEAEKQSPGSQRRVPGENVPLVWAQSLYIISLLLMDRLLHPSDIDPLGRRLIPASQTPIPTVQVVLLSDSPQLQALLATFGLPTQTLAEVQPVTVAPPSALRDALTNLGRNSKLGLTGRVGRPMGALSTSRLYRCQGRLYCFLPHFLDREEFYMVSDESYLLNVFESTLGFLRNYWTGVGRPTMVVLLNESMFGPSLSALRNREIIKARDSRLKEKRTLLDLGMQLKEGAVNGVKVRLGRLQEMIPTSQVESLDFLASKAPEKGDLHTILSGGNRLGSRMLPTRLNLSRRATEEGRRVRKKSTFVRIREGSIGGFVSPTTPLLPSTPFGLPIASQTSTTSISTPLALASSLSSSINSAKMQSYFDGVSVKPFEPTSSEDAEPRNGDVEKKRKPRSPGTLGLVQTFDVNDLRSISDAAKALTGTSDLHEQADLLQYIFSLKGKDFIVENFHASVGQLLEEVYIKARDRRIWDVVRQSAGVLSKMVNSLTSNLTDLLVRKIPVSVGFGNKEFLITSSMNLNPVSLREAIFTHTSDARDGPLVEELITYLGGFIRSDPVWFTGIFRLRTFYLVAAMRDEISRSYGCLEEDAHRRLMESSPFEIFTLVRQVLTAHQEVDPISPSTGSAQSPVRGLRSHVSAVQDASSIPLIRTPSPSLPLNIAKAGRKGLPSQLTISVQSAHGGFVNVHVVVDGHPEVLPDGVLALLTPGTRGILIITIDFISGTIEDGVLFDTHFAVTESAELLKHLHDLDDGKIIIVVTLDEVCQNLTPVARRELAKLGSRNAADLRPMDLWVMVAQVGNPAECVEHAIGAGFQEKHLCAVEKTVDLAGRRKDLDFLAMAEKEEIAKSTVMAIVGPCQGRWYRRRRLDGALNRVPEKFYSKCWAVLNRVRGLSLTSDKILYRDPLTSEKTPEEFNFALVIETFLDSILNIGERAAAVELLSVLHQIFESKEVNLGDDIVDLLDVISDATRSYWKTWVEEFGESLARSGEDGSPDFNAHSRLARRLFFDLDSERMKAFLTASANKVVFKQVDK